MCISLLHQLTLKLKQMTTIESIQMNIHSTKLELNAARKVITTNEIEKLHIEGAIEFYLNELQDLQFSLNCAVKQS